MTTSIDLDGIQAAIRNAIGFLSKHQYPNGVFCVYTAKDDVMVENCQPDDAIFPTALIANSLLTLRDEPCISDILSKSAIFFQEQMLTYGLWQHYSKKHIYHSLVSPDLDDTCCISSFMESMGNNWIRNFNTNLVLANRNSEGLFYTWIALRFKFNKTRAYWKTSFRQLLSPIRHILFWRQMECSKYDVDAVVNANILYYLGVCEATEPVIKYLIRVIQNEKENDCDKWYRNPFSIYYFISRNYVSGVHQLEQIRDSVIKRIARSIKNDGRLGESALDTALGITTLLNFSAADRVEAGSINYLLAQQSLTGEWARRILYYGGPKKLIGWGSEELTTAFCLEALALYQKSALR